MNEKTSPVSIVAFESKWIGARPELGLALRFVEPAQRPARSAWACLVLELGETAFGASEAEPALIKLQWWFEELLRSQRGEAQHPLSQGLAASAGWREVAPALWQAVIAAALAQRDAPPAADRAALLDGLLELYGPLSEIEARLFAPLDAAALARQQALGRALVETARLGEALRQGRLPLPLSLLARHRLARSELAAAAPAREAALRDWFAELAADYAELADAPLGAIAAAARAAESWRAGHAARAAAPLIALHAAGRRLPLVAPWAAWRAARRSRT